MDRRARMELVAEVTRLARGDGELRAVLKSAGTLSYDGNNPLDKAYALTDLFGEVKRGLGKAGLKGRPAVFAQVEKAHRALEEFISEEFPQFEAKL